MLSGFYTGEDTKYSKQTKPLCFQTNKMVTRAAFLQAFSPCRLRTVYTFPTLLCVENEIQGHRSSVSCEALHTTPTLETAVHVNKMSSPCRLHCLTYSCLQC